MYTISAGEDGDIQDMSISSVTYDCKDGEFGVSVASNGDKFFFPFDVLEMILCSGVEQLDMVGFKEEFDTFRNKVHELAWKVEGWDKNKKRDLEMWLNEGIYRAYSIGVSDGILFEQRRTGRNGAVKNHKKGFLRY